MTLLEQFERGDIRALSKLISHVENRRYRFQHLLGRLYSQVGRSLRIGVTGPPGAGKSTIVNELARLLLAEGKKVGIIAVDPTSPFTGGALLGDRVRMNDFPTDGSIFFRSMATRGASGGLAAATDNVAVLYDSFGFDVTLIETVGVGQVELDVIDSCDVVVVALVPESGDAVQMLKAGLMEIADIFCLNKADRPGADRLAADLRHTLQTRQMATWDNSKTDQTSVRRHTLAAAPEGAEEITPIIQTEATSGKNIDQLYAAIMAHATQARQSGLFDTNRKRRLRKKILNIINHRFRAAFINSHVSESEIDAAISEVVSGESDPYQAGNSLYELFLTQREMD